MREIVIAILLTADDNDICIGYNLKKKPIYNTYNELVDMMICRM